MILEIVEKPEKVLSDGHIHKFPSAYNPAKFVVQRKDYIVTYAEPVTIDGEQVTRLYVEADPEALWPSAGYVYAHGAEGETIKIDKRSNIYPYYTAIDGEQVITSIGLLDVPWENDYYNINLGHLVSGTTDKQDLIVTGFVRDNENNVFTPRRYSFDLAGQAHVYINAIVQDYFAKRLNVKDMLCVGQTLGVEITFTTDNPNTEEQVSDKFDIDYGLIVTKSVKQLGQSKYMDEHALYLEPETGLYDISFRCRDSNYNWISFISVSITKDGDTRTGGSGSDGRVTFLDTEPGTYVFNITHPDYKERTGTISVNKDDDFIFTLIEKTYDLTFVVQDENNNLVENAEVYLEGRSIKLTDANGEVTYTDVPEDTYNYSVSKDGYTDKAHEVTIDGSDKTENVTLEEKAEEEEEEEEEEAELIFTLAVDLNPDVLSGDQDEQGGKVTYNNEEYFADNTPISFDVFEGATIELMAMALGDYIFDGYYEGGEKIHASEGLSFEITEDRHITAKFVGT